MKRLTFVLAVAAALAGMGSACPPKNTPGAPSPTATPSPTSAPTVGPTTAPTPTPTPTPTTAPFDFTIFNGPVAGIGTLTGTNPCGFSPTATLTGTLTVDAAGKGTWLKTHGNTVPPTPFMFSEVTLTRGTDADSATMKVTKTFLLGSTTFNVTEDYGIFRSTPTIMRFVGTQMFVGPCGQVIYAVRMDR